MTICNNCDAIKKETNHWFVLYFNKEKQIIALNLQKITFDLEFYETKDFCGEACLINGISKLLYQFNKPEPPCECRFTGDRTDSSECPLHNPL